MTIFKKEMMDTLRDRRTLVVMLLLPVLMMPAIMIISVKMEEWSNKSKQEDIVQLMVTGEGYAPGLINFLREQSNIELTGEGDPVALLKDGKIDVHLIVPEDYASRLEAQQPVSLTLQMTSVKPNSQAAVDKVSLALSAYSAVIIERRLEDRGQAMDVLNAVAVTPEDTATEKEKGGTLLGFLLPMFIILFAIIGGMYTAIDVSAGEKERKTLESLLMTPASRMEIVIGKFMAVALVSIVTIVLSMVAILISARFMSTAKEGTKIVVDAKGISIMLPIALLLAAMFAALLLAISIFAKSYKEAQNYITPLYLATILPVIVVSAIPDFGNSTIPFVIPVFNAVVVFKELLVGDYILSHILITIISLVVFTALSIRYAANVYSREDVLFEGGRPGWGKRLRKHRAVWS